jgi:hypothetical protein
VPCGREHRRFSTRRLGSCRRTFCSDRMTSTRCLAAPNLEAVEAAALAAGKQQVATTAARLNNKMRHLSPAAIAASSARRLAATLLFYMRVDLGFCSRARCGPRVCRPDSCFLDSEGRYRAGSRQPARFDGCLTKRVSERSHGRFPDARRADACEDLWRFQRISLLAHSPAVSRSSVWRRPRASGPFTFTHGQQT